MCYEQQICNDMMTLRLLSFSCEDYDVGPEVPNSKN